MLSLLVVEDDRSTHALFVAVVNRCGFEAVSAFDGAVALRRIRAECPDAMILDLLLPTLNGFEILREVKGNVPDLLPRTIVVTAAAESTYKNCEELRQVCATLRKPFNVEHLVEELQTLSKQRRPAAPRSMAGMKVSYREG
jgi:DNA-binding response OmpR family regulator